MLEIKEKSACMLNVLLCFVVSMVRGECVIRHFLLH